MLFVQFIGVATGSAGGSPCETDHKNLRNAVSTLSVILIDRMKTMRTNKLSRTPTVPMMM